MPSSRKRKTLSVLLRSFAARLMLSPGRGPIFPKTGIMWKRTAAWVTMCSASSIFPVPVGPFRATTPPSRKGLPLGAVTFGVVSSIVWSLLWSALLKLPPSISSTWTMPSHVFTLHRSCTFVSAPVEPSTPLSPPPKGWSYQGKWIRFSGVSPRSSAAPFIMGWKVGMRLALPSPLSGGRALKMTSVLQRLFVSSSQRMPRGGALAMRRAERFTQTPRVVYSMRWALPQTPQ
mmetsp:Transcript_55251/g.155489  ORF Transcript_55251/g.155489 Transcript_55251/m.155489 type:complete len:232 (+) Transcript_55251:1359-2054(+)